MQISQYKEEQNNEDSSYPFQEKIDYKILKRQASSEPFHQQAIYIPTTATLTCPATLIFQ